MNNNLFEIKDAQKILEKELENNGFDITNPEIEKALNAFHIFSEYDFNAESDGFLFETGIFDFTGEDLFYFSLTRQFSSSDSDEYNQLHLELLYQPSKMLKKFDRSEWAFKEDGDDLNKYFSDIKESEITKILKEMNCLKCEIYFEET